MLQFKSLTWQQVAILTVLLAAPIAAHYAGGQVASGVMGSVGIVLAWLMKSPNTPAEKSDE